MKKKLFIFITLSLFLQGCNNYDIYPNLGFEISSCIYIEGKIYWESETVAEVHEKTQVGIVKKVAKKNHLPDSASMVSDSGGIYVGKYIYKSGDDYFVLFNEKYHKFVYNSHMDLGQKIQPSLQNEEVNGVPAPGAAKPNFVYKGMRYMIYDHSFNKECIDQFQEVGTIKKFSNLASENFEGSNIGNILYTDRNQNRYILVKNKNDELYIYENESYMLRD